MTMSGRGDDVGVVKVFNKASSVASLTDEVVSIMTFSCSETFFHSRTKDFPDSILLTFLKLCRGLHLKLFYRVKLALTALAP